MEKLPTEVFCKILHLVHPDDHTECLLVCRKWRQVMEQFILFHTVCLQSPDDLTDLLEKIQRNPEIANQIERLALVAIQYFDSLQEEAILSLLPNLKMLHCDNSIVPFCSKDQTDYPWHKNIQQITGFGYSELIAQRLSCTTYPNLTTLQIGHTEKNVIPLLKNAPALKHLILSEHNTFTYQDLDEMHRNLPILKTLDLEFQDISNDANVDYEIEPAYSLTDFAFRHYKLYDDAPNISILKYVIKKYPNLSKLECDMGFSSLKQNDKDDFNENEWIPLIQKLGSQLKAISMSNTGILNNFSDSLDQYSCQIEFLELYSLPCNMLQKLSQGNQALYIQTLILGEYSFESFDWLSEFQVLKKMVFLGGGRSSSNIIKLDELAAKCPQSLKSLSLGRATIKANPDYIGPSVNIDQLSFYRSVISVNVDTFVNVHMPRLSKLKFDECKFIGNSFQVPATDVSSFYYMNSTFEKMEFILVLTLSDNKRVWHFLPEYIKNQKRGNKLLEAFYYTRYSRSTTEVNTVTNSQPLFTLVCNSLKNAYITR